MKFLSLFISLAVVSLSAVPFSKVNAMTIPNRLHLDGLTFEEPLQIHNPQQIPIAKISISFGSNDGLVITSKAAIKVLTDNSVLPTPSSTQSSPTPTSSETTDELEPTPTVTPTPTITATPTPTPTSTPMPAPASPQEIDGYFEKYSNEYRVDRELLRRIAACESGYNAQARNGAYGGMFQFAEATWTVVRGRMGADANPDLRFNAEESIRTAAYHIANGGQNAWPNCK